MFTDTVSLLKADSRVCQAHPIILLTFRSVLVILLGVSPLIPTAVPIIASVLQLLYVAYHILKPPYQ
jgi:hypothetical protein